MATAPDDPPPLLGSWRALYALELGALVVVIGVCLALTWIFR